MGPAGPDARRHRRHRIVGERGRQAKRRDAKVAKLPCAEGLDGRQGAPDLCQSSPVRPDLPLLHVWGSGGLVPPHRLADGPDPVLENAWWIVVAAAALVLFFKVRGYALKVQDRIIRLEERLRLEKLLSEPLRGRIGDLSVGQLIGLRFAPDGEVEELVRQALEEQLSGEEIKKRIKVWRPDSLRV